MRAVYEEQVKLSPKPPEYDIIDNLSLFRSLMVALAIDTKTMSMSRKSITTYSDEDVFKENLKKYVQSQFSDMIKTDKYDLLKLAHSLGANVKWSRIKDPDSELLKAVELLDNQGKIKIIYKHIV